MNYDTTEAPRYAMYLPLEDALPAAKAWIRRADRDRVELVDLDSIRWGLPVGTSPFAWGITHAEPTKNRCASYVRQCPGSRWGVRCVVLGLVRGEA